MIVYPATVRIIDCNAHVLREFKAKKADKPEILSMAKLDTVLHACRALRGDLYDKAAFLLQGIVRAHAFASGNRRTALLPTKDFVVENGGVFAISDDPKNARALQGAREGFYTSEEIKEWITHGTIREFRRQAQGYERGRVP